MKIGVIIPTCNRPSLLPRAVASVLKQTLPPDEIIIVNDGWEPVIIKASRVKVINTNGPRGLPFARAEGIRALSSDIEAVCYVDDDDEMLGDHIQLLSEEIKTGKQFAFSLGLHRYPNGTETLDPEPNNKGDKHYYDPTALLVQNIAPPSCFMHTIEAYREVGGWDEECLRIEDWDLWGRMFIRYGPPAKVNKATTVIYKGHGVNLTDSNYYNYSMACSWRDIVADRLKHMASQNRYKITNDDRKRFHVPRIGFPVAFLNEDEMSKTLNSIITQEDVDFEVLLTVPTSGTITDIAYKYAEKDKRMRLFPFKRLNYIDMMNWSLLVSRSEYLGWIDINPQDKQAFKNGVKLLDFTRKRMIQSSPLVMRRRVIETIGGITSTLEDLVLRALKHFGE